MSKPELSVVVPVYNRSDICRRAITSALSQDVDLEVVVVDDGSIPATRLDIDDPRVRLLTCETNRGAAAARNLGLQLASSEWVAFLDSDDVWLPGTLAPRLALAKREADAGVIWVAGFAYLYPNGVRDVRFPRDGRDPKLFASGCWFCPGSTALFRRDEVLNRIGGQDEALRRLEDTDWFLRWALAGGDVRCAPILAAEISRGSPAALSAVQHASTYLLAKHSGLPPYLRRRLRAYLQLEIAAAARGEGRPIDLAKALIASFIYAPRAHISVERFWHRGELQPLEN